MARKRGVFYHSFRFILRQKLKWVVWAICGLMFSVNLPVLSAQIGQGLSGVEGNYHTVVAQSIDPESLWERARIAYQNGEWLEAVELLKQAEAMFGDRAAVVERAVSLSYLSLVYQKLGQWQEATEAIATSMTLLETVENPSPQSVARILNVRGHLELAQGNPDLAFTIWQQATEAYRSIGDRQGMMGSSLNQARSLEAMGFYPRSCNILLEIFDPSLTCEELTDANTVNRLLLAVNRQPNSDLKVTGLRSLGTVLRSLGKLDNSLKILQQSLGVFNPLSSEVDSRLSLLELGNTYQALAQRSQAFGSDASETETYRQNALNAYGQAAASSLPSVRISAQLNRMELLIATQQFDDAANLWQRVKTGVETLSASQSSVNARIKLARSLDSLKSRLNLAGESEMRQLLNEALADAETLNNPRSLSAVLGNLGWMYERQQGWETAIEFTEKAIAIGEGSPDLLYQWHWQLGRILTHKDGEKEAAIASYIQAYEILQDLRSELVSLNPDIQFSFREKIEPVYREFVDLLLKAENPSQANLKRSRDIIEALQLAEIDNFFQDACVNVTEVPIDEILENSDREAALFYTIILPDRLEVILKLPTQSELLHYRTRRSSDRENFEEILTQLQDYLPDVTRTAAVKTLANQVYRWLIQPAQQQLAESGVNKLVFILDDPLRNIPMSVLYDETRQKYLIEDYAIAITPGLKLLGPKPLESVKLRTLAAGISEPIPPFQPLPSVKAELEQIQLLLPSEIFLNQESTRQAIEKAIESSPFSIVHLATHGNFSSNPENTFLLLADGKLPVTQMGELLTVEDPKRATSLQLLVLSACQTARGDKRAALGLAGVAVRVGASSTVATLWTVNDDSTAFLIRQFYENLKRNLNKAEALRQAQLALLEKNSRPYAWSPYVLVGNWL